LVVASTGGHTNLAYLQFANRSEHDRMEDQTNLKKARTALGLSQARLGALAGTSGQQIDRLEKGERKLTREWAERLAPHVNVPPEKLVFGERQIATVPLVGYVGAGSLATVFSDGQGPFDEVPAPDGATDSTVCVEIRGESLGALFDRWLIFYDEVRDPPRAAWIGKLCVIGCADGRVLVKKLARGQLPGHYTLLSNTEPPIYDVLIDWAAPVKTMQPR
jgi:transcriptional regulator with XRE-family HTH domain